MISVNDRHRDRRWRLGSQLIRPVAGNAAGWRLSRIFACGIARAPGVWLARLVYHGCQQATDGDGCRHSQEPPEEQLLPDPFLGGHDFTIEFIASARIAE